MKRKLTITLEFEAAPVYDEAGNEIPTTDEEYVSDILHIINSTVGEEITSATLDGVEFCHADGLNAGGWIPCSERLPEDGKNCLITYISFLDGVTKCCDGCAYVIENGWFWCLDDSEVKVDVIAWMPLPEPYKGE